MTAVLPENLVTEAVRSLEVRWIFPGQLEPAVAEWFGRFPAVSKSRTDTYLVSPDLRGLSVKVRAGGALEVKVYHGSPGILEVPGRARGHLQSWRKWSFPFRSPGPDGDQLAGWRPVDKTRRTCRFPLAGGQIATAGWGQGQGAGPRCTVELTEVHTDGEAWWSLGYEATGPADLLRGGLEATAARVFARALPAGVEFGTDASRSFAEWLSLQPATRPWGGWHPRLGPAPRAGDTAQPGRSSGRLAASLPCSRPVDWPTSMRYPSGSRM
jgi:hypothetical protein